jgi:hypothetical protein
MTRPRLTIAQSMAIVLYLGIGLAGLRNANAFWASATFTLAVILISAALLGAYARRGRDRLSWAGFALFGWAYLLVDQLTFGLGRIEHPPLLIAWLIISLDAPLGIAPHHYSQVSHSLAIIVFGLIGAVVGRLVAVKDDRPKPGTAWPNRVHKQTSTTEALP